MISVENLIRGYGDTVAVDGISFEVKEGEVLGLLGPNGAGKTTTLKVLSGFLHPTDGKVSLAGQDVAAAPLEARRLVGYLPENNPLYEEMEVTEYLDWAASVRGLVPDARRRAMKTAIERCGLGQAVGKEIGTLSKGYRQRVGLAAALVHDPPILLLDEPTSGLDPNQAAEVRSLIAEIKREKTVMLSTHILSEVRASCDRVVIIHKGKIAAQGRPEELTAAGGGQSRLRLVLKGDGEAARGELEKLPGAGPVACERSDGEAVLSVACAGGADLRERVFKLAVQKGWPLLELHRESADLEQVFRSLTG